VLSKDQITSTVLPIFFKSCKDPVANVRLFTAKLLKQVIPKVDSKIVQSKIKPALLEMVNDSDRDTQYFVKQAISAC